MKGRIILGALSGIISSAALAADSARTEVYGVLDTFVARSIGAHTNANTLEGGGALLGDRIGLRGSEPLGNGVSVIYTMEWGFRLDTNEGTATSRQSWVGLKADFGSVTAGFQYAPGWWLTPRFDPFWGSGAIAPRAPLAIAGDYTISGTQRSRWGNSIRYESPAVGGFQAQGIYSYYDEDTSRDENGSDRWGVGLKYNYGKFDAAAVFHNVEGGANMDDTTEYYLGLSYDFGPIRLTGSWQEKNADGNSTAESSLWSVNGIVPVSASGTFEFGYAQLNPKGGNNNGKSFTVGYIHALSKRTALYAAFNL